MKNTFKYFLAVSFNLFIVTNVTMAAEGFVANEQPLGYIQPMALSSFDLKGGATGYRPWFENGAWQGDIIQYSIASSGAISTTVDLSSLEASNTGSKVNWSARLMFNQAATDDVDHWKSSRKIITHDGTGQVAFRWNQITDTQKEALDKSSFDSGINYSPLLNFIRGARNNEKPNGGFRARFNILGDIVHSNPVYVGAPSESYTQSSYIAFKEANKDRKPRVYVGANDGMLHVFDADTGEEVYAFIPPTLIPKLYKLAQDPYEHTYFVDGEISVKDVYYSGKWRTVLLGGLGAGGSTRFALDITNPNLSAEGSGSGTDNKILWIKSSADDAAFGDSYGAASTVKLSDGNYYGIVGNGYNSTSGVAQLILTNIGTGAITKISTSVGSVASPNGLSTPSLVDQNGDGKYDYAYAGDLNGNLWKFDLTTKTVAYNKPVFTTATNQPITTKVSITTHPNGGKLVYFGTGKVFNENDLTDSTTQAIYGIWDKGITPGTADLHIQTLSIEKSVGTQTVKTITNHPINWLTKTGWKVDLSNGQRVITNHTLRDGRVQTTVTNPINNENWLFEPHFLNGGPPEHTIFDIDGNGALELSDNVNSSNLRTDIPVSWKVFSGIMSSPLVARISNGIDTKFLNYEELAVPLKGEVEGVGFIGGHIDVDTDAPERLNDSPKPPKHSGNGFAAKTTAHTHEYDKIVEQPYVDYFQVNQGSDKQLEVDEVLHEDKEFFVVIANGDLSAKSELHIGNNVYNVLEYQRMIQRKLANWQYGEELLDDNGNSLIVSIKEITKDGGTLRNAFDSHAIIDGGLHPTETRCVKDPKELTYGRWRNGALITQLIDPEVVKNLEGLHIQIPMKDGVAGEDGGIVAKGDTVQADGASPANGLLYESSLFWHYGKGCYGTEGYEENVAAVRKGLAREAYEKILSDNGFSSLDEVVAAVEEIELKCQKPENATSCQNGTIEESGKTLEELKSIISIVEYIQSGGTGDGGDGDTPVPGDAPLVIVGGNESKGITAGPNFVQGRRTWIDITDQ